MLRPERKDRNCLNVLAASARKPERVFSPDSGQCVQSIRACSWITTERPFKAQRRNALLEAAICEMTED